MSSKRAREDRSELNTRARRLTVFLNAATYTSPIAWKSEGWISAEMLTVGRLEGLEGAIVRC